MKKLYTFMNYFIGVLIMAATVLLFINIILRYFFGANMSWTEEFVRYSMIWITFLGMATCFHKGIHFSIDILIKSVSIEKEKWLQLLINIISIIFVSMLIYFGLQITIFNYHSGQVTPSLGLDIFWIYLAIPVGGALSILHLISNTINLFKNKNAEYK